VSSYLRPNQIEEMKSERDVLKRTLQFRDIQERSTVERQLQKLEDEIDVKSPPKVSGEEMDRLVKEEESLRQEMVDFGMPSHEEMRKNPPGAVGKHMRWDKFVKEKDKDRFPEGRLRRWKEVRLILNRGSDDPDIANFETYRPAQSTLSMDNAQISGQQFYGINPSQAYKENYDQTFGENEIDLRKDLAKLREELEQVQAKAAHEKASETVVESKSFTRQSACGQVFEKPSSNGAAGAVRFHEQKCDKCLAKKLEGAD
jgi:hypothetical protein